MMTDSAFIQPPPAVQAKKNDSLMRRQRYYGWLMGSPAFLGLILFIFVPFIMALVLSFSDQRLLSPNPTEGVGFRNYDRLLAVTLLKQDALHDDQQKILLDEKGAPQFERLRTVLRKDPSYKGYSELSTLTFSESRFVILAKDPLFIKSFVNTIQFAILVIPLQCGAALLLALLVNMGLKGTNFFRTAYFAPVVTSMVVVSIVWTFLYHKDVGLINEFLSKISFGMIDKINWLGDPKWAMPAIVIMSAWQGAGYQMLIFLAGLQNISEDLYEAASLDGANSWQKFVNVTLPGLRNTTIFVIISTTIAAFGLFTQVSVMTAGGPADSTTTVMYHAVRKGFREQDIGYGSTISVVYFLVILAIAMGQKYYFDKREK
ncbi:sugar ABC transporter permease [uncultured Tolumonas sp.]|uniref:carbohydrate ABC transporter permease n=1 Tax=uncultured Tolumonas sp. TaxID=263765 RepID=UPI002A0A6DDE|nr:sugar ABC transporter permease [uncultured Tolumonas sp.]